MVAESWPHKPIVDVARNNQRIECFFTFMSFLLLWSLTAFRSANIGNDTKTYIYYFDIYSKGLDRTRTFEVGYQYLNYFIGKFTSDHHVFLMIIATIMYGGVIWYIYKNSKNIAVSFCLFYCYFFSAFTSMFRQGIAMAIVLFGYHYLKKEKKLLAAVFFLTAMTFHTTAVVCFFLYLNSSIMRKKKFVFGMTIVCGFISSTNILGKVVDVFLPRYSHYFVSRYASSGWLAVSYNLLLYLIWYFLINKSIDDSNKQDQIVATNFALLLIFAAFGFSVNLFTRVGEYFLLIAIAEIPNMLYRGKVKHFRKWLLGICTMSLIMFVVTLIYRPGWNHIYPYEFWR
jgi:hypothetical protein